jgi:putative DNA primase/helicase
VPWEVVIPAAERDEGLPGRLALELEAVLAWLVAGYADWHEHGLADPEPVTAATAAYRAESDALARFIEQRCLTGAHFHVRSAELFATWAKWCAAEGEEPGTQTAFSVALTNRGLDKQRSASGFVWRGVGLQGSEE